MFKLLVQSIFLLLLLGSQRSSGIPAANSVKTLPEGLDELDMKNGNGDRGSGQHLDCQAESGFIQEQIPLMTKTLADGKLVALKQNDLSAADETILVLGKAGAGKTSLIQFLTENPKLQSKKVRWKTSEYIIEDGEKIGTSETESFTLYPELVSYNATINFCDSPGFHNSRSSVHEIVSMDVMRSVISKFKNVKILLIEEYGSLQYSKSKVNFMDTLRDLSDFLVDIDRYKDHIVLIASKLPFRFRMPDEGDDGSAPELITEEMHIERIMDYLNHTEISIVRKLNQKIGKSERDFYQKVIKLLQSLQTRDKNGKAARISVFRRPHKSGSLMSMPLLNQNKESLTKTIINLNAVQVQKNDFHFTLSNGAKLHLKCLLKLTIDNFIHEINDLFLKLNEFVVQKIQNYTSFHQVLADFESFYNALKQFSDNLDGTRNYDEFFEKVNNFISEQRITTDIKYNELVHVLEKYNELIMSIFDTDSKSNSSPWSIPMRQLKESVQDELQWYRTLDNFISGLSSYKIQRNKTEIHSKLFHDGSILTDELMDLFVDVTGATNLNQFIDARGNIRKTLELESVTNTLLKPSNITCDEDGRLLVEGFQICLAEINSKHLIESHCNNITVKEVALLAVDAVYLDEDTVDIFRGVDMFVVAPKWEVIGQRRIVLSGQNGGAHHSGDVDNGTDGRPGLPGCNCTDGRPGLPGGNGTDGRPGLPGGNGTDGRPGLPGGNGGNFFGIGLQFVNGKNLLIESNGGRGGQGTDGAKGMRGPAGRDAAEKLKSGLYSQSYKFDRGVETSNMNKCLAPNAVERVFRLNPQSTKQPNKCENVDAGVRVIIEEGDCGGEGGAGGFGGEAGIGGYPGDQKLIQLGDSSEIQMQNQNGRSGTRGKKGKTGERGMDGIGMICVQVTRVGHSRSYMKCESTNTTSPACNSCDNPVESQYTTTGMEKPAPKKSPDFSNYLLDYIILLESHSNHTIFNQIITSFREAIQRKYSYPLNHLGLLFFEETTQQETLEQSDRFD